MKRILIALAAIPVTFWFMWVAFPATAMQSMIEDSVGGGDITVEVQGLKKGFFYTVSVDRVVLKRSGKDLAIFNDICSRINPFGLLRMQLDTSINGQTGSGKVSGRAVFAKNKFQASFECQDINIQEAPFVSYAGIRGTGVISGRLLVTDGKGRVDFAAKEATFEPADFSGIMIPMNFFNEVTGSLLIEGDIIEIASIFLGGKDIHARLKGKVKHGFADLAMELMPGRSFLDNPLFTAQLAGYQISPGYYMIPMRGKFSL